MNRQQFFLTRKAMHKLYLFAVCILLLFFISWQKFSTSPAKEKQYIFLQGTDTLFKMCDVMPGPEVEQLSPFGKPFKNAEANEMENVFTSCHYNFESKDDYPQIEINLNVFKTSDEAIVDYNSYVESFKNLYEREPNRIRGLCDSACFMGNADPALCDDCSLIAASGRYFITVAFKGYYSTISAMQKQQSAVNIVKKLFEKKPFLKSHKS